MKSLTIQMTVQQTWVMLGAALVLLIMQGILVSPVSAAGNVEAMVVGEDLIIEGDASDNRFTVLGRSTSTHEFTITGEEDTTINGLDEVVMYVTGEVIINTNAGDDRPRIDGNVDKVTMNTGPGNDWAQAGDPVVHGDLVIDTGPGNDYVDIQDTMITETLRVETGVGNDQVHLFYVNIGDDAIIKTGKGEDSSQLIELTIDGAIIFED